MRLHTGAVRKTSALEVDSLWEEIPSRIGGFEPECVLHLAFRPDDLATETIPSRNVHYSMFIVCDQEKTEEESQ